MGFEEEALLFLLFLCRNRLFWVHHTTCSGFITQQNTSIKMRASSSYCSILRNYDTIFSNIYHYIQLKDSLQREDPLQTVYIYGNFFINSIKISVSKDSSSLLVELSLNFLSNFAAVHNHLPFWRGAVAVNWFV